MVEAGTRRRFLARLAGGLGAKMDDLLREFLTETFENLETIDREIVRFEKNPAEKDALDKIFRLVHTIKGTCGFLSLARLERVAHAGETVLGQFRDGSLEVTPASVSLILHTIDRIKEILLGLETAQREPEGDDRNLIEALENVVQASAAARATAVHAEPAEVANPASLNAPEDAEESSTAKRLGDSAVANQSIRVSVPLLERMMTLVGELVLTRNQLLQMVRNQDSSEFKVPLQRLSNVTSDLQDSVMKTRMQPIGHAWSKLPRLVRDLGEELGKKFILEMHGAETELDRQVMELIKDPLVHMVRNSADHGLESSRERKAAGKPEAGRITLRAHHEGGHIVIEIADDGRGLSTARIRDKALRLGLGTQADLERMSEPQIQKFIFNPGFSTAETVTSISGRGVGLDVVRTNIEQIGGTIDVQSVFGEGTTVTIKIPLTLAIVSVLIIEAAGQRYALPQIAVVELVRAKAHSDHRIEYIHNAPVLRLRDRLLPLVDLSQVLGGEHSETPLDRRDTFIIVTQVGNQNFGIVVDQIYDTEEIVVKPVASIMRDIPVYSGNTILGDGSVIMIIDPNGVSASVAQGVIEGRHERESAVEAAAREEEKTALLVFRAGAREPKAVPLSLVTRLEEIDASAIERCDGRNLIQYRGRLMPVMHIDPSASLKTEGRQPMLVFAHGDRSAALAVDEIIDITNEKLDIELASTRSGIIGSATIKGQATEIVDVGFYLTQLYPDWLERMAGRVRVAAAKRVLLVDSSPFFLNMLAPLLNAGGYKVTTVPGSEEALKLRDRGEVFDIIVSDVDVPGANGVSFAAAVKTDEKWAAARLIALTALAGETFNAHARDTGYDAYISKFERERLLAVLSEDRSPKGEAA